jgi:hypothetical protein
MRNLFSDPKPSDLITVPCCENCRWPTTKDDEYFRLKVGMCDATRSHPDIQATREVIFKSLDRQEAGGLKRMALGDLRMVDVYSPVGLHGGQSIVAIVDRRRIERVISRIVRGLYWHETGRRLAEDHDVFVVEEESMNPQRPDIAERLVSMLSQQPQRVIGNGVFSYRYLILMEPCISVWHFVFWQKKWFIAVAGPKQSPLFV